MSAIEGNVTFGVLQGSVASKSVKSSGGPKSDFATILADFREKVNETPYDRIRDSVLKSHNLTKEDFEKLPQAAKDAIVREIQKAIQRVATPNHQAAGASGTEAIFG